MKDNRHLTFAERARLIKKKYNGYEDDPISAVSLNLELSELAKEQEEKKKDKLEIAEPVNMGNSKMAYGGNRKMFLGGPDEGQDPLMEEDYSWIEGGIDRMNTDNFAKKIPTIGTKPFSIKGSMPTLKTNNTILDDKSSEQVDPYQDTEVGFAGMAGILGAGMAALRKPTKTTLERFKPSTINSEAQEQLAKDGINTAFNNVAEQSRETAQTSGQRMGRTSAVESNRSRQLATTLSSIRERNDNTNTDILNQAGLYNNGIANQETIINEQNQAAVDNARLQFFDSLGKSYAQVRRDQNAASVVDKQNKRMLEMINSNRVYRINQKGETIFTGGIYNG